jgi:HlyD family secretion protein
VKIALTIVIIFGAVVIGGLLIAGPQLQSTLMELKPKPKSMEVRSQEVQIGALMETVAAPGEIEPHTQVIIYAEVSARIEALPFEEGEFVSKSDIIVRLDDRDLKAALASRQAQRDESRFRIESERSRITGLRSDLEFAQRDLERQKALYDTGDIPLSRLDEAQQRVQVITSQIDASVHTISVMESSLAAAEANIARAERDLENTIIRAPMDGVITVQDAEVGEAVLGMVSNMGTRIMTISDLSRMVMKAKVPESDIADVAMGQDSRIHINAYPDEEFSGTVTKIALQRTSEPDGTGYFETEIEIDLRGKQLRSGLNANVDIEIAGYEGVTIP